MRPDMQPPGAGGHRAGNRSGFGEHTENIAETPPSTNLDDLRHALATNAGRVALDLLGEPSSRAAHQWRWGRKGSLALDLRRGLWHDHERGEGGDLLDLIRRERGGSFPDTVGHAAGLVGLAGLDPPATPWSLATPRQRIAAPMPTRRDEGQEREARAKQERALDLWRAAGPVDGSPGAIYLRRRGIDPAKLLTDPPGWPETLRWHRGIGALVVAVNDARTSLVVAVHRIFLDDDGRRSLTPDGTKRAKLSLGAVKGNAAMLSAWPDLAYGRWGIAEGPESALAATMLAGHEVWAALSAGNMPNVTPPLWARRVTIFADHDANEAGMKAAAATLANYRARGLDARVLRVPTVGADAADLVGGAHA